MTGAFFLQARLRARRALRAPWRRLQPFEGARARLFGDFGQAWTLRQLCFSLAHQKSIARFRTTSLGPIWIVLSFIVSTLGLAVLWSHLMGSGFAAYFTYITLGFFVWNFFIGVITDGARSLIENRNLALQTRTPMVMYPIVATLKQLVIAAHNLPYVIGVLIFFGPRQDLSALLVIPGLALMILIALGAGVMLSIWCAYIADLSEVIAAGLRFVFFFTPILWMPFQRANLESIWIANPFFHAINVVRGPLLHQGFLDTSFPFAIGLAVAVWIAAWISYWGGAGAVATRL